MPVLKFSKFEIAANKLEFLQFERLVKKSGIRVEAGQYETPYNRIDYFSPAGITNSLKILKPMQLKIESGSPELVIKFKNASYFATIATRCKDKRYGEKIGYRWAISKSEIRVHMVKLDKQLIELLVGYAINMGIEHETIIHNHQPGIIELFAYHMPYSVKIKNFKIFGNVTHEKILATLDYYGYKYNYSCGTYQVYPPYWRWESHDMCHLLSDYMRYHGHMNCIGQNYYDISYVRRPTSDIEVELHAILTANNCHETHVNYIIDDSAIDSAHVCRLKNPFSRRRNAISTVLHAELINIARGCIKNKSLPHCMYSISSGYGVNYDCKSVAIVMLSRFFELKKCQKIIKNINSLGFELMTLSQGPDDYCIMQSGNAIGRIFKQQIKNTQLLLTIMDISDLRSLARIDV